MSALPLRDAFIESRSLSLGSICHRALIKTHFSQSDQSQRAACLSFLSRATHTAPHPATRNHGTRILSTFVFGARAIRARGAHQKKTSGLQFA
jgi:hypothetical protein